ncbi:MAG: hypothetical protein DRJ33_01315 [Candidatus Methanomethylicota archaeon]|uniref:Uncharacterized protein n=1 Tax=Thermoproteota archaeon TaxID=2056631 RepID=A0A497F1J3_9CREN|nr:MAG: hypothetical protein DRJ33_01315 [Candidatus Verstraetearchaeota archaeon]
MVKLAYGDEMSASLLVLREKAGIAMVDDINPCSRSGGNRYKAESSAIEESSKRGLSLYQSM